MVHSFNNNYTLIKTLLLSCLNSETQSKFTAFHFKEPSKLERSLTILLPQTYPSYNLWNEKKYSQASCPSLTEMIMRKLAYHLAIILVYILCCHANTKLSGRAAFCYPCGLDTKFVCIKMSTNGLSTKQWLHHFPGWDRTMHENKCDGLSGSLKLPLLAHYSQSQQTLAPQVRLSVCICLISFIVKWFVRWGYPKTGLKYRK